MTPAPHPKPPKTTYPPEFKQNAVRLITELGRSYKDVAEQFKCSKQTIRYWVAKHNAQLEPTKRTDDEFATGSRWRDREDSRRDIVVVHP